MGNLEAAPIRSDLNPVKEQTVEETLSPEKVQECRTDSGRRRWVFLELALPVSPRLAEENKTKF